jgi:hypothetical protein
MQEANGVMSLSIVELIMFIMYKYKCLVILHIFTKHL